MPMPLGQGFRGPDGRVGYLLRQAQHTLRTAMYQPLAEIGITAAQYSVLSVADAEPGLSGAELARDTMLTPQSVNAIVVHLERAACSNGIRTPGTSGCGGSTSHPPGTRCWPPPGPPSGQWNSRWWPR